MEQIFALLSAWSLVEWIQVGIIALVVTVPVDMIAARKLFWGYAAATHIDKVRRSNGGKMTKLQWWLSWDSGIATALLDVYCQISFSKYFMDLPREVTLSQRLSRYLDGPDGRNKRIAETIRDETKIDSFDWRGMHL